MEVLEGVVAHGRIGTSGSERAGQMNGEHDAGCWDLAVNKAGLDLSNEHSLCLKKSSLFE